MKTVHTILPNTILNSAFKLRNINSYDVIAIDVYPSMLVTEYTQGCKYNNNKITNLLYCSAQKLRKAGFNGQIWYVYQAFYVKGDDEKRLVENMKLQQETIITASRLGISGIVPFGLTFPSNFTEPLVQGVGSFIEEYIKHVFILFLLELFSFKLLLSFLFNSLKLNMFLIF